MALKFKIAVLGIGGVGGYLGARLAAKYAGSTDIEIIFIARNKNADAIKSNGLKLIMSDSEQTTYPDIVTDQPGAIGVIDLLICCVKNYDLETSIGTFKNCVSNKTVILPFLNGLDASERIKGIFPEANVWEGCAYIISKLLEPGIVKVFNNNSVFYFGAENPANESLEHIHDIFTGAGINAIVSTDILQVLWEKFLYISPFATVTSGFDLSIGGVLKNQVYKQTLISLQRELKAVAKAKGIVFPDNIIETQLERMVGLPYESSSSMHNDFKNGNKTELKSLTGYVIDLGKELNIPTPEYDKMLQTILEKWS